MSRWAFILAAGLAFPWPCRGADQGLASGVYGATLGAGAATASERGAWGQTPAAFRAGEAGLMLHVHRPFGIEELRVAEAGGYWDFRRTGTGAWWRQTSVEDLFTEHGFEGQVSRRLGGPAREFPGSLDVGGAWCWWRGAVAGRPAQDAASHGYGLVWHVLPRLRAGAMVRGLPLRKALSGATEVEAAVWQWGFEVGPVRDGDRNHDGPGGAARVPDQTLRFEFRKTGPADWRALAGISIRPHSGFEVTMGLASAPFQFSAGFRLAWAGFAIHQAYRHHRHLGATWLNSLAFAGDWGGSAPGIPATRH